MMSAGTVTEIYNNKRIIVDGCDGVVDYSDDCIILRSARLKITVDGRDLKLKVLTNSAAVIEGLIVSINYGYF